MPLTLEQYASYLDTRDLPWPAAPARNRPKARPHLAPMPEVQAVVWNLYGTLLAIGGGDLVFQHPQPFVMELALDKTVQEFKMWGSMTRKPGQPSEYLAQLYTRALDEQKMAPSPGEKNPEIMAEKIWESIIKKLLQKEYQFDAGFFGSLNEYSRKVAYFFHASLQGTAALEGAAEALEAVHGSGRVQGLTADGQCFSLVQLKRGLTAQGCATSLEDLLPVELRALSADYRARKPSDKLFRHVLAGLSKRGIEPGQVLHVGSRIAQDIVPAKRLGLRTALYAGDKESLQASAEQLKDAATRPDALITELTQITELLQ
jgi:hypothetical protein